MPASIEIVVDNAVAGWPAFVFALNLVRDMVLARVLFHELWHHLDATIGAAAPTGEAGLDPPSWAPVLQASLLVAASIRRHGQTFRALDASARAEEEGRIGNALSCEPREVGAPVCLSQLTSRAQPAHRSTAFWLRR